MRKAISRMAIWSGSRSRVPFGIFGRRCTCGVGYMQSWGSRSQWEMHRCMPATTGFDRLRPSSGVDWILWAN